MMIRRRPRPLRCLDLTARLLRGPSHDPAKRVLGSQAVAWTCSVLLITATILLMRSLLLPHHP